MKKLKIVQIKFLLTNIKNKLLWNVQWCEICDQTVQICFRHKFWDVFRTFALQQFEWNVELIQFLRDLSQSFKHEFVLTPSWVKIGFSNIETNDERFLEYCNEISWIFAINKFPYFFKEYLGIFFVGKLSCSLLEYEDRTQSKHC